MMAPGAGLEQFDVRGLWRGLANGLAFGSVLWGLIGLTLWWGLS